MGASLESFTRSNELLTLGDLVGELDPHQQSFTREDYFGIDEIKRVLTSLPVTKHDSFYWCEPDLTTAHRKDLWIQACEKIKVVMPKLGSSAYEIAQIWSADALIGAGEVKLALDVFPDAIIGSRATSLTETRISLKSALGQKMEGKDIIGLFGNNLTSFGKRNLENILPYIDIQVTAFQDQIGRNLYQEWFRADTFNGRLSIFSGFPCHVFSPACRSLTINWQSSAEREARALIREAENTFREESGIARIGEGWVSETELFYAIRRAFPKIQVIQHARPSWLGREHLDIFLPEMNVAVEYQGVQHDIPVEFFGGEAAFLVSQKRDRRKARLASRNGVRLIYVRAGYNLSNVISEIQGDETKL